jgi:hypothetical protein
VIPMRTAMAIWSLLLLSPLSLSAQREDTLGVAVDHSESRPLGTLLLAGTAGMITGAFTGGFIGSRIDSGIDLHDADGVVIGAFAGTTLLIPLAVHLANDSRGDFRRSLLVSALVGGSLLAVGTAIDSGELILAIPFVQLVTAAFIERNTGSR